MYSTAFWCLLVVLLIFLALLRSRCYSFHRTKWSLRSVGVLDLEDQLEKRSLISPSNRAICAGLRDTPGFRPVPVTTVALTN